MVSQQPVREVSFLRLFSSQYSVIILVWGLCYVWRLLYLGFYSDDYNTFFVPVTFYPTAEWWNYEINTYPNRILCGVFSYLALISLGVNPIAWQAFGAVVVLVESILFLQILQRLNGLLVAQLDATVLTLMACLWLINPFAFGFTAWPTYMIANLCVVAFQLATLAYLSGRVFASLALFTISCLILEAYYFQFILFLGLSWIYRHRLSVERGKLLRDLAVFSLIQVSFIVYNRLMQGGVRKSFNLDFIITRISNVLHNPQYWGEALIPFAVGLFFVILLVRSAHKIRSRGIEPNQAALLLVSCCAALNLLLYLAVGYSLRPFGIASKTMITISTLFMFMIFFVAQRFPRKAYGIIVALGVCFIPLFGLQTKAWADSWSLQQEVVRGFPAAVVAREGHGTTVLAIAPNRVDAVVVFEEPWALGSALQVHYPELRHAKIEFLTHKFGTFSASRTVYDGLQVTQVGRLSGHSQSSPVGEQGLLIWNYYDKTLRRVRGPFVLEEDVSASGMDSISKDFVQ